MTKADEDNLTWKWRVFWTEYDHARNRLAKFDFLEMTPSKVKQEKHFDIYYFLPGTLLNLKKRDSEIIIAQEREKRGDFRGYIPRKTLSFPITASSLSIPLLSRDAVFSSSEELLEAFSRHYPGFRVYRLDKQRSSATFIHPKDETKKLKAEFSEIRYEDKIFQTLCLESKHRKWLRECSEQVEIVNGIVSDYYHLLALL